MALTSPLLGALALGLTALLAQPAWSGEVASLPVSMEIQDSCEIRSQASPAQQQMVMPSVICIHGEPYQAVRYLSATLPAAKIAQPAARHVGAESASSSLDQAAEWTVTF